MKDVSVNIDDTLQYSHHTPYYPPQKFPEFEEFFDGNLDPYNRVYNHIRDCIRNLGLDYENMDTAKWNPFSEFISKGDRVVIKPNLVLNRNVSGDKLEAVVTHASVIRPVVDYVLLALGGTGEVIIGDAPQANADFNKVTELNGLKDLVYWYQQHGKPVSLCDFRKNYYPDDFYAGVRQDLAGDPNGYVLAELGEDSFFSGFSNTERLYGSDFDRKFIVDQHNKTHKYLLAGSVMKADVVICIPKLKTHRKAGVTINSKNMVGANGDKNYLPHYRVGSSEEGGDEYPNNLPYLVRLNYWWSRFASDYILKRNTHGSRVLYRILNAPFALLSRLFRIMRKELLMGHGDWHGNDTTWRMCLDLNQIILFADSEGVLRDKQQRKYFCLVDGIVAGEEDGPLSPTAKSVGYVACGLETPFKVDYVCIWQMGFSPAKLKVNSMAQIHSRFGFEPDKLKVVCYQNGQKVDYRLVNMRFMPQKYWVGHVERD